MIFDRLRSRSTVFWTIVFVSLLMSCSTVWARSAMTDDERFALEDAVQQGDSVAVGDLMAAIVGSAENATEVAALTESVMKTLTAQSTDLGLISQVTQTLVGSLPEIDQGVVVESVSRVVAQTNNSAMIQAVTRGAVSGAVDKQAATVSAAIGVVSVATSTVNAKLAISAVIAGASAAGADMTGANQTTITQAVKTAATANPNVTVVSVVTTLTQAILTPPEVPAAPAAPAAPATPEVPAAPIVIPPAPVVLYASPS